MMRVFLSIPITRSRLRLANTDGNSIADEVSSLIDAMRRADQTYFALWSGRIGGGFVPSPEDAMRRDFEEMQRADA